MLNNHHNYSRVDMWAFQETEARLCEQDDSFATVGPATRRVPIPTNVQMAAFSRAKRRKPLIDWFISNERWIGELLWETS